MSAPDAKKLRIVSDIVASLTIGASVTLAVALLGAAEVFPNAASVLLRPGSFLSRRFGVNGATSFALFFFGDAICYGLVPFFILRLRSSRRARPAKSLFERNSLVAKIVPAESANQRDHIEANPIEAIDKPYQTDAIDEPYQIETGIESASETTIEAPQPSAPVHLFGSSPDVERRRAPRQPVSAPVFVYGWDGSEPFSEVTETLNISAVGGLMVIAAKVTPTQELILINASSEAELPCRVARTLAMPNGSTAVALEFLQPAMSFWEAHAPAASA